MTKIFNPLVKFNLDAVGSGAVDSVNGATGAVVLTQDNIGDGTTYKQYSTTEKTKLAGIEAGAQVNPDLSGYLTSATAASTYQPLMGADDNYVTDAQLVVIGNTSNTNSGDNAVNSNYSGLAASKADVGQTMYIGTTAHAINRASAAEGLAGITSLTPGADFTIVQNAVSPFTSVETGAVANTLYLKEGNVGIGTTTPAAPFHIHRAGSIDELFRFTSYGSTTPSLTIGTGDDAPGVGEINLWRAASGVVTVYLTGSLTHDTYFNGGNVAIGDTTAGGYKLGITGSLKATEYYSGDGTQGATGTVNGLVFKDGLYTSGSVDLSAYLTSATAASTYQPLMGADDNYVTDAEKTALHPAVTLGTNTASALSLSTQALSIGDVFVQNAGDTIAGDISINSGYRLGVGVAVSSLADIRVNSTATNTSSLYAGIWQSVSYAPASTPSAGANARGLLFQVSTPNVATDLSNAILYGALGQVTHGGSGALGQAIGMNPGVFLTGSGAVTTSAGITLSATASGGGAHTTFYGFRTGGLVLSGGSTLVNNYAFYADAVSGATNNYSWLSNAGLFVVNETGDASSDLRVEGDTNTHLLITDASADCVGINVTAPAGKLDIQQTSSTAAIPTLILDQSDLSEEFIQFEATVAAGNPLDTAALGAYYGKARVSVNGTFKFLALYS